MSTLQRRFALIRRYVLGVLLVVPLFFAQGTQPQAALVQFDYSGLDSDTSAYGSFTIDDVLFDGSSNQSIPQSNLLSFSFSVTNTVLGITGTWDIADMSDFLASSIIFDSTGIPDVVGASGTAAGGPSGLLSFVGTAGISSVSYGDIMSDYGYWGNSNSDPIINGPSPVPLPAALPLFGSALAMLGIVGWRRRRLAVA